MKPWEEERRTNALDGREVECPAPSLDDDDAYRIAEAYMGSEDGMQARFDRARFIAAAPDMARALLGIIACSHADGGIICVRCLKDARAALIKAGVPIP